MNTAGIFSGQDCQGSEVAVAARVTVVLHGKGCGSPSVIFCLWEVLVMGIPHGARYGILALRVAAELVSWGMCELAVEVASVSEVWPCEDLPWN